MALAKLSMGSGIRVLGALAVLLLSALSARAESRGPERANPELLARGYMGPGGAEPTHALTIERLGVSVDIVGGVAHATVTAAFRNPTTQILEGDFTLRLPPGAAVTGYALDVNGTMVDGVLVGQRKARLTYQARVRRGADPGIAEVTRDDSFRTHVFPIFPGAGRVIRLEFGAPVPADGALTLPLSTLDGVGSVDIDVRTDAATGPALEAPEGVDLRWRSTDEGPRASGSAKAIRLSGALSIGASPPSGAVTLTRDRSGDRFFEIDAPAPTVEAAVVRRVRIYWDTSLSRRRDDLAGETALLGRYLDAVRPGSLELITFAESGPVTRAFNSPADLLAAIKALRYGGATSLRGVLAAGAAPVDACLLFSDGRITLDAYAADSAPCPLFTLSGGDDADHGFLSMLARKSGGEHIDLLAQNADQALARLTRPGARVTGVWDAEGQKLDITPLPAAPGRLRLTGRSATSQAVTVRLADGRMFKFDLTDPPVTRHDGMAAIWAVDRIAEMTASDRPDPDLALRFARRYGVAAGGAAFLVLEQLGDYVDAGVAPPLALGKSIQADYAAALARKAAAEAERQSRRLAEVVAEWAEQKAWWSASHLKAVATVHRPGAARNGQRPSPPPALILPVPSPPPQPAVALNVPVARPNAQEMVVTGARIPQPNLTSVSPLTGFDDMQGSDGASAIAVTLERWDPARPYLAALKASAPDRFQDTFDAEEKRHGAMPAFYLDVAEYLYREHRVTEAIHMVLGALELPSADASTLIVVADRLMRYGDADRAIGLYERVLYLDPDRPQPRRSLALALIERAERAEHRGAPAGQVRADYRRALDLLNEVVTHIWDPKYQGIELVALMEANRIAPRLERLGVHNPPLDPRLRALLDVDLRVTLEWNIDATDMDLWVDEPDGERAIYNNPHTAIGGRLSHDMTQGYGPEEYLLRRAPKGEYTIRVNIYATDSLNPNGGIVVRARLFSNYGRPDETSRVLDLELTPGENGARVVGAVTIAGSPERRKEAGKP